MLHNPPIPFAGTPEAQSLPDKVPLDIIITPGSQDGLCKVFFQISM